MKKYSKRSIIRRAQRTKPFTARDGALIYELFRSINSPIKNMSIAAGYLKPSQKALPHFHKRSEEIYYILSGTGQVRVGDKKYKIRIGDTVYVAPQKIHALENASRKKRLEILAITSPAYTDEDTIFV